MKKIVLVFYSIFAIVVLFYISLPNFDFPIPPPDSVQSQEPADVESSLRRAYFTNFTRRQVLDWYSSQFTHSKFLNITLPTYRLNYPPEESQTIIRDQTRSTFLEEIVHPFRETVFINGYEPAVDDDKNRIVIDGVRWRQKIIVRYVPTDLFLRLIVMILALIAFPLVFGLVFREVDKIFRLIFKQKKFV